MQPAPGPTSNNIGGPAVSAPGTQRNERKIIFLICLLAAIHVFIFSAAFPFFNNVDEPMHFDLIVKYSHGDVPRGKETVSPDSAAYLALFASCAYFGTPDEFPGGQMPLPPWTEPPAMMQHDVAINSAAWQSQENYEASQPPLYYALTGLIWRTGQRLHMDGGHLLYALRFLNIAVIAALVVLGYFAARLAFPENFFARIGVPLLIALLPQTAFYSLSNDPLSPLCFGALFICLGKWLRQKTLSAPLGVAMGLAFAATYLAKITNFPLLFTAATFALLIIARSAGNLRGILPGLLAFLFCALPPIAGWMLWCKSHYGDFTGSKLACEHFGLVVKPFAAWWRHPIFSPSGVWTYLSGQFSTFWQGEFFWHNHPLLLPGTGAIFTIFSLILLAIALQGIISPSRPDALQRQFLAFGLACFLILLGFFAVLSVIYNFDECPNPSRDYPYFHQGRLMLGALIPFLLVIVYGLDRLLNRFGNVQKFAALALLLSAMLATEITTDWPIFTSPYNWFHLP